MSDYPVNDIEACIAELDKDGDGDDYSLEDGYISFVESAAKAENSLLDGASWKKANREILADYLRRDKCWARAMWIMHASPALVGGMAGEILALRKETAHLAEQLVNEIRNNKETLKEYGDLMEKHIALLRKTRTKGRFLESVIGKALSILKI